MWTALQLIFGLLALVVTSYNAFVMYAKAVQAQALGSQHLADMAYAVLLFNVVLAVITLIAMIGLVFAYRAIERQRQGVHAS